MLGTQRAMESKQGKRGGKAGWKGALTEVTENLTQLHAKTQENHRLSDRISASEGWKTALIVSLTVETASISKLAHDLATSHSTESVLRQHNQSLTVQNTVLSSHFSSEKDRNRTLQCEYQSIRKQVQSNGQQLSHLSQKAQEITRKIWLASIDCTDLNTQLANLQTSARYLQSARDYLRSELPRVEDDRCRAVQRCDALRKQVQARAPPVAEALLCVACFEGKVEVVLAPCAHLCLCTKCVRRTNKCPLCRQVWTSYEFVYV